MTFHDYEIAISSLINGFRHDELKRNLDVDHVDKWIRQFDEKDRYVVLTETFHALNNSYYKIDKIRAFCKRVLKCLHKRTSLENYSFICAETAGQSQKLLLNEMTIIAKSEYGIDIQTTDKTSELKEICIYVDDGLYTGCKARTDLLRFVRTVSHKEIVVFLIVAYSNNLEYTKEIVQEAGHNNNNEVLWNIEKVFKNDKKTVGHFDTVWPHSDVLRNKYIRQYGNKIAASRKTTYLTHGDEYQESLFTNPETEKIVSSAFLTKGFEIIGNISEEKFRPLGFDNNVSFGFGSFFATDFNISNTCPLVLWWGTIEETGIAALDCWYPLLPRRSNSELLIRVREEEEKYRLVNYYDVLLATYKLATKRAEEKRSYSNELWEIDLEAIRERRENDELLKFLYNLNMDQIKIIGTMMYIGRDFVLEPSEEFYTELENYDGEGERPVWNPYPVNNPDNVVLEWLSDLEETFGEEKYDWVEQIHQKIPLNRYLHNAFYRMGILEGKY